MGKIIEAADLFCGAGGTSTGLALCAEKMGLKINLTAVNHWDRAIETHAANHPWAQHLQTSLDGLKPSKAVPGGRLDLLVASPECTHHSNASGGKPKDDQSRASAWHVLHWCQELYIRNVIVENVPEFIDWGPLGANRKPLKSKRGFTFHAFVQSMEAIGYKVLWQIANCANYGDATTRRRFFMLASRGRRPIFPAVTHGQNTNPDIFGHTMKPWKPAQDIIDWSIPGHSIFLTQEDVKASGLNIKRPLVANTLGRIAVGIERYWGDFAEAFLILLRGTSKTRKTNRPIPALTAGGGHIGLAQPMLVRYNDGGRLQFINRPLSTLDTSNRIGLLRPLILNQDTRGKMRTVEESLPTIACAGAHALVQPFIMATGQTGGGCSRVRSIDDPLSTLVTKAEQCMVRPFLIKYNRTGLAYSIDTPLDTVTTNDRFGLVRPQLVLIDGEKYLFDILFRMLTPAELAAAHSFPHGYKFKGTKTEVVKQIGNSVPVKTATALCATPLAA